jgi:hypothetical protein
VPLDGTLAYKTGDPNVAATRPCFWWRYANSYWPNDRPSTATQLYGYDGALNILARKTRNRPTMFDDNRRFGAVQFTASPERGHGHFSAAGAGYLVKAGNRLVGQLHHSLNNLTAGAPAANRSRLGLTVRELAIAARTVATSTATPGNGLQPVPEPLW